MNLFIIKDKIIPSKLNQLIMKTPLGNLIFNCSFSGKSLIEIKPNKIELINDKTTISSWIFQECYIEFLKLKFNPTLPIGMKIDECICGMWRIKIFSNKLVFKFGCYLESNSFSLEGYPESGEGLIAQTWENSNFKLTIGTEDEEFLEARAIHQQWLPIRFKNHLQPNLVDYLEDGVEITLPEFLQDETLQTHFIAAWSSKENPDISTDISTWYAVDAPIAEILKQANVE